MAGFLSYFLPKDKVFYNLFENASNNLQLIAEKLVQVVHEADYNKREALIKEMHDIEHDNDNITHLIFVELGRNFITPFDREDIHSLATALDDVADYIYSAGKKLIFTKSTPYKTKEFRKAPKPF
jgi:predicted phosphate transport protein (TIGR00153 family)